MEWISIRIRWPEKEGMYWIKDCRHGVEGHCRYDGYEFEEPTIHTKKSSLMLVHYTITHWMPMQEPPNEEHSE